MYEEVDWRSISSMSENHELKALERWVKEKSEIRDDTSVIKDDLFSIEIGAYHGKTTAILAQFGRVVTVDLWGNVEDGLKHPDHIGRHSFNSFIENMVRLDLIGKVYPVCNTSDFFRYLPFLGADIVFIDGSHFYENVVVDIFNTIPHLVPDGFLIIHDYKRPGWKYPYPDGKEPDRSPVDPWAGVGRAVDELLEDGEFIIHEHYAGIVALKRKYF